MIFVHTDTRNLQRESICFRLFTAAVRILQLPHDITVRFAPTAQSVYGYCDLMSCMNMRVTLSNQLMPREIPRVFVHELLHVEQIMSKRLSWTSRGGYMWAGKEYAATLPYAEQAWEQEVAQKQHITLQKILHQLLDTP